MVRQHANGEREPDTDGGGDIDNEHPRLVIPYFTGDEGRAAQRPLSKIAPPVIGWLCPSIHVQGVGYSAAPGRYLPDLPLSIVVEVDNRGVPNAMVTLDLYWAAPSTGFASPSYLGSVTWPVAGRAVTGPTRMPALVWTPTSADIPAHFCLLAHVSCTPSELDPGPAASDPLGDRHWAQYNLISAAVNTAMRYTGAFWAANPGRETAAYTVTAHAVPEDRLNTLARIVKAEPVALRGRQLTLHRTEDTAQVDTPYAAADNGADRVVLELAGGERLPLVVAVRDLKLGVHQFTALELVQTRVGGERSLEGATGSLGIVLFTYAGSKSF